MMRILSLPMSLLNHPRTLIGWHLPAPSNEAGALKHDFRSSKELFGALKEGSSYWISPGMTSRTSVDSLDCEMHDLGGGVSRRERSDGIKDIMGLTLNGMPIAFGKLGGNMFWEFEPDAVLRIRQDALRGASCDKWKPSLPSVNAEISQFTPGVGGRQFSIIQFSDGRVFEVFSDRPLAKSHLSNLAQVISENPDGTVPGNLTFFVMEKLGETRGPDGTIRESAAVAHPESNAVFLTEKYSNSLENAHWCIDHECGHVKDHEWGGNGKNFSQTAVDWQGRFVFGSGKFVPARTRGSRWGSKGHSDFIREYSSRNCDEDFADSFALTIGGMKSWGNKKTFLTLPPGELKQALRGYSPGLRRKLLAIIRRYRQEVFNTAPQTSPDQFNATETKA